MSVHTDLIKINILTKKNWKHSKHAETASRRSNSLRNPIARKALRWFIQKKNPRKSIDTKIHIRNWISAFETLQSVKVWSRKGLVNSYRPVACRGKASATNTCTANETSRFQLTRALNLLTKSSRSDEIDPLDRLGRASLRKIVKLVRSDARAVSFSCLGVECGWSVGFIVGVCSTNHSADNGQLVLENWLRKIDNKICTDWIGV